MNIFVNRDQKRLRAGWRILIQVGTFIALLIGLHVIGQMIGEGPLSSVVGSVLYLILGVGATWMVARFVDRRRFVDLGFRFSASWWLDFCFGLALGAIVVSGVFFSLLGAGWVSVIGFQVTDYSMPFAAAFAIQILLFIAVGVNEELTFRGYQLKNLAEGFSGLGRRTAVMIAVLMSSTLFGLAHLANEGANAVSTANIVLAGFLLGLPYLLTGELAISIGIHITFNLFEGSIYGFAVSGGAPGTHLLDLSITGPHLWTGGAFGPEAGLMAVLWMIAGCALILVWVGLRKKRLRLREELADYTPVGAALEA